MPKKGAQAEGARLVRFRFQTLRKIIYRDSIQLNKLYLSLRGIKASKKSWGRVDACYLQLTTLITVIFRN